MEIMHKLLISDNPESWIKSIKCAVMLLPFHWQWCRTCSLPLPPGWHSRLCHNTPNEEIQRRSYLAIDFPLSQCLRVPVGIFSKEYTGRLQFFIQRYTMKLCKIKISKLKLCGHNQIHLWSTPQHVQSEMRFMAVDWHSAIRIIQFFS